MAALNISPAQVRQVLAANNYLAAVGQTKGALVKVNLTANTDLHTADDFKKLVVRRDKDTLIRLSDIADVVLGAEDYDTEVRFSQQRAVFMGIRVLPNANSVDVIKRARVELEQIKRDLPTGMEASVAYDATAYINDAMHEVFKTLIETLCIVMLVIFSSSARGVRCSRRSWLSRSRSLARCSSCRRLVLHSTYLRCLPSCSRSGWWSMTRL